MIRNHIIDRDVEVFFQKTDWENTLKTRVDIHHIQRGDTFLQAIARKCFINNENPENKIKESLDTLKNIGYVFKPQEMLEVGSFIGSPSIKTVNAILYYFDFLQTETQTSLQQFAKEMANEFKRTPSPILIDYLENKGIDIKHNNVVYWLGQMANDTVDFFETMPFLNDFMDEIHKQMWNEDMKEEEIQRKQKTEYILNYIQSAHLNTNQLSEMLHKLFPPQERIEQYVVKNKIDLIKEGGLMQYFLNTVPKPREWFTKCQIEVIEILGDKVGEQLLQPEVVKKNLKL